MDNFWFFLLIILPLMISHIDILKKTIITQYIQNIPHDDRPLNLCWHLRCVTTDQRNFIIRDERTIAVISFFMHDCNTLNTQFDFRWLSYKNSTLSVCYLSRLTILIQIYKYWILQSSGEKFNGNRCRIPEIQAHFYLIFRNHKCYQHDKRHPFEHKRTQDHKSF